MKKIRLLLADDHAILRAGLRVLLDAQPDMTVVAEPVDKDQSHRVKKRIDVNSPSMRL
jgi:two-component system response regulator NreC